MDGRLNSIVKTLTLRIITTLTTAVVAFVVSGELTLAAEIGGLDALAELGLYYARERFWIRRHRATSSIG